MFIILRNPKIILTVVILNLCILCSPVWADSQPFTVKATVDNNTRLVKTVCSFLNPKNGVPVTMLILGPSDTPIDLTDTAEVDSAIIQMDTKTPAPASMPVPTDSSMPEESGKCTFYYTLDQNAMSGEYTVICGVNDILPPVRTTFYYTANADREKALNAVDGIDATFPDTADGMIAIIDKYYNELSVQTSYNLFSKMDIALQHSISNTIRDGRPYKITNEPYNTSKFSAKFNELVAVAAINTASATDIFAVITADNENIGLDLSYYNGLSAENQTFMSRYLYNKGFVSTEKVRLAYEEGKALVAVNNCRWEEMGSVLAQYNNLFGLNLAGDYASLGSKEKVHKELCLKRPFQSISALKAAFDAAVDNEYDYEHPASNRSSLPGSHVDYSGSTALPIITPPSITPPADGFIDLGVVPWAAESIKYLKAKGIVTGDGSGNFHPLENITREEYVKMLVIAFGLEDASAQASFTDVDRGAWYYKYIASAEKAGLVKGQSDGSFGISARITRQDMATMAYRAAVSLNKIKIDAGSMPEFSDVNDISSYALEGIAAMQKAGIIQGMQDGRFAPNANASRAQAAKIISGLLTLQS